MYLKIAVLVLSCCAVSVSASCSTLYGCSKVFMNYYKSLRTEGITDNFLNGRATMCKDQSNIEDCTNKELGSCRTSLRQNAAKKTVLMYKYVCDDGQTGGLDLQAIGADANSKCKNLPGIVEKIDSWVFDCEVGVNNKYAKSLAELGLTPADVEGTKNSIECRRERESKNCYQTRIREECGSAVTNFFDGLFKARGITPNKAGTVSNACKM